MLKDWIIKAQKFNFFHLLVKYFFSHWEGNYAAIIMYCNTTVEINYLKALKRPEGIRLQHESLTG